MRRRSLSILTLMFLAAASTEAQSIFTYAGGGSSDGKPATAIPLSGVAGIALDRHGNLFLADKNNHRVRKVLSGTGVLVTVAGNGAEGVEGDGSPATAASVASPEDVAVDASGNIYIAARGRSGRRAIRVVDIQGTISTVTEVDTFGSQTAIAVDPEGRLYYSQATGFESSVVRLEPLTGSKVVVAGGGSADPSSGGPATAASLKRIVGMAVDARGDLYLVENASGTSGRLFRIDAIDGTISLLAGGGQPSSGIGDGEPATQARLVNPQDVVLDSASNLYLTDRNSSGFSWGLVRRIDAVTGNIDSILGSVNRCEPIEDPEPATESSLCTPIGIAIDPRSNLYVSDGAVIRKLDVSAGIVTTAAGTGAEGFRYVGDHGPATAADLFLGPLLPGPGFPMQISLDRQGNLYFNERGSGRIRRVERSTGIITTAAGGGRCCARLEGTPATEAYIGFPGGVAVDSAGNVFFSDGDEAVWLVDATTGLIRSFAGGGTPENDSGDGGPATQASLLFPAGLALDQAGNLFIADNNHDRIRRVDRATGVITTVAGNGTLGFGGDGGPATAASLFRPTSVTVDSRGNLFIADSGNNRVRMVDSSSGIITTFAGNGSRIGVAGDGGPAIAAGLERPTDVAVDAMGNLFIADSGSFDTSFQPDPAGQRIRRVDAASGIITTLAGTGTAGIAGDSGPAAAARLAYPSGVAVDDGGTVFIADTDNNRIRIIAPCIDFVPSLLSSPASGSAGVPTSPRLEWSAPEGALRFDLLVDTIDPPMRVVGEDVETTSLTPSNLESLTTYYWRIVAKGDPFCEPARTRLSEVRSFTTTSECSVPDVIVSGGR